jgi:hypothetical protein
VVVVVVVAVVVVVVVVGFAVAPAMLTGARVDLVPRNELAAHLLLTADRRRHHRRVTYRVSPIVSGAHWVVGVLPIARVSPIVRASPIAAGACQIAGSRPIAAVVVACQTVGSRGRGWKSGTMSCHAEGRRQRSTVQARCTAVVTGEGLMTTAVAFAVGRHCPRGIKTVGEVEGHCLSRTDHRCTAGILREMMLCAQVGGFMTSPTAVDHHQSKTDLQPMGGLPLLATVARAADGETRAVKLLIKGPLSCVVHHRQGGIGIQQSRASYPSCRLSSSS